MLKSYLRKCPFRICCLLVLCMYCEISVELFILPNKDQSNTLFKYLFCSRMALKILPLILYDDLISVSKICQLLFHIGKDSSPSISNVFIIADVAFEIFW